MILKSKGREDRLMRVQNLKVKILLGVLQTSPRLFFFGKLSSGPYQDPPVYQFLKISILMLSSKGV